MANGLQRSLSFKEGDDYHQISFFSFGSDTLLDSTHFYLDECLPREVPTQKLLVQKQLVWPANLGKSSCGKTHWLKVRLQSCVAGFRKRKFISPQIGRPMPGSQKNKHIPGARSIAVAMAPIQLKLQMLQRLHRGQILRADGDSKKQLLSIS